MATEKSDVVPEGIDSHESPFALQPATEGFPFDRDSEEAEAIREVIEQADHERAAAASAGTGTRPTELPASIDPAASPFEAKEIEGLPLTKKEREELGHAIEEFDRERAAAAEGTR